MKNIAKRLCILIIIALAAQTTLMGQTYTFSGGSGSAGNPYQISNLYDLYRVRDYLAADANSTDGLGVYFKQTTTIDLLITNPGNNPADWDTNTSYSSGSFVSYTVSGDIYTYYSLISDNQGNNPETATNHWVQLWKNSEGWLPIGGSGSTQIFRGNYDGDGNSITNLYINRPDSPNVGLFGHVGRGSSEHSAGIKKLALSEVYVIGGRGTGSLAGRVTGDIYTLIEGCSATGVINKFVKGNAATGGLVGSNNSYRETPGGTDNPIISKSFANIDVEFSGVSPTGDLAAEKFGGLAGCNQKGTIRDSYSEGSVTVDRPASTSYVIKNIGGLAGCILFRGRIERSFSSASITIKNNGTDVGTTIADANVENVGGLVGNTTDGGNVGVVQSGYYNISIWPTSAGASTGLSNEQFIDPLNYFTGFDFDTVWQFTENKITLRDVAATSYLTWTGNESDNWLLEANWSGNRLPGAGDIVVIPKGSTKYPIIAGEYSGNFPKGINIAPAGKLVVGVLGRLSIPVFLLSSTSLDSLIIKSDNSGTGSLIHTSTGIRATVERFIPSGNWNDGDKASRGADGWHLLSSPVIGQTISPTFITSGENNGYDFYGWDETTNTWMNYKASGFNAWNNNSDIFHRGRGYLVSYQNEKTFEFEGEINDSIPKSV